MVWWCQRRWRDAVSVATGCRPRMKWWFKGELWLWDGFETSQRCRERWLSSTVRGAWVRCKDGGRAEEEVRRGREGWKAGVGALTVEVFGRGI